MVVKKAQKVAAAFVVGMVAAAAFVVVLVAAAAFVAEMVAVAAGPGTVAAVYRGKSCTSHWVAQKTVVVAAAGHKPPKNCSGSLFQRCRCDRCYHIGCPLNGA